MMCFSFVMFCLAMCCRGGRICVFHCLVGLRLVKCLIWFERWYGYTRGVSVREAS